jgi:C4-dicarboxylate-specific signal transduction histidine kinase
MEQPDPRLDAIIEVLLGYARQDFSRRAPVSDALDAVDAIATGLNMMAEELDGAVASRRELMTAYDALKDAQARLVHTGKLAAIGQLASGVVHEVNNPASWVALALGIAKKRVADVRRLALPAQESPAELAAACDELDDLLGRCTDGVTRILTVVEELRTFARSNTEGMELVLIDDVVKPACNLIEPSIRTQVRLVVCLGEVPPIRGNRGRLGQVVTNLVVNAAEAVMATGSTREVRVTTHTDRDWVLLSVEDAAFGVPEDLRHRIFDPFFTTNPLGTGLGLSLVSEIVTSHGGEVTVGDSELGGARFDVRLPVARG